MMRWVLLSCLFTMGAVASFAVIRERLHWTWSNLPRHTSMAAAADNVLPTSLVNNPPASTASGSTAQAESTEQLAGAAPTLEDILSDKDPFRRAAEDCEFAHNLDADAIQKALGEISSMRQGTQQIKLEQVLLRELARTDPAKAVAAAMAVPNAHAAHELADPVFQDWLKQDATGAWAWANNLSQGLARNQFLSSALAAGAKKDSATTEAYILQISAQPGTESIYRQAATVVAKDLAKNDPAAMAKFVSQLPEGPAKASALCAGAEVMAKTDPKAAADLLSAARPSIDTGKQLANVLEAWSKTDISAAIAYGSALPGTAETRAMELLVPDLAKTDPKSAVDVASKLNDPEVTQLLQYELPKDLKIENADQAITAAAGMPDNIKSGFLEQSAMDMVAKDPESAARLLQQLPEGQARNGAMESVVYTLSNKDLSTAQAFVNQVPAGAQRDSGLATLINLSSSKPDQAMQLALGYSGEQIRSVQLPYLYSRWFKADPTAAQAWLSTSPLDDATRQKMANPK